MTYVDERIVELRFDNKQFEQETAKSMNTLDKLKEKLSFKNASSGAEQLQKAVANINVNPIIQGIGTIETRMSALGIAGKRIIENLTDWAMSGINKVIHKLNGPINQIITGGKSRAQNIEQAKFQLEGLGVAWSEIEEDISYGVQDTAYGLDAAAKVASQLVASQVELGDEMKHALLGISGVAAMTNSSYEDIGRVYTTVAGNGRLMGDQLLQLSSRGINAAAQLAKALNTTESDIRDMVSKGQISFKMFSEAMFESFGEHAKSANKTFQGALSNTKAALSRLGADVAAQGFNSIRDILNEIIPKLKEFKKKIKPVEDAIIKMVDAIGKLIQSFIKAIDIESIVNKIAPPIQKVVETITEFLDAYRMVFEEPKYANFTAFIEQQKGLKRLEEQTKETTEAMVDLTKVTDEQKQMANDIWEFGKYGNGADRVAALGDNYANVQAYIEKMIELGWDEAKMNEYLENQRAEQEKEEQRRLKAEKRKKTVENILKVLNNLKRAASNIFKSITNVLSVAFDSFGEAFSGKTFLEGLINLTEKFADFTEKIMITEDRAQKLKPIFDAIFTVAKTLAKVLFTIGKGLATVIGWLAKLINKAKESEILNDIFTAAKDAVLAIIEAIKNFYRKLKESGAWDTFVGILKDIVYWLGERMIGAFNGVAAIAEGAAEGIGNAWEWVKEKVKGAVTFLDDKIPSLKTFKDIITEKTDGKSWLDSFKVVLSEVINSGKDIFTKAFEVGKNLMSGLLEGIKSVSLDDIERATGIIATIATTIAGVKWLWSLGRMNNAFTGMAAGITQFLDTLAGTIKAYGKKAEADAFANFADSIVKIVASMVLIVLAFIALDRLGYDANDVIGAAFWSITLLTVITGVVKVLSAALTKANTISTGHTILGGLKTPLAALTILATAIFLTQVVKALVTLYSVTSDKDFDTGAWWKSIGVIGLLLGLLIALTLIMNKIANATVGLTAISTILFALGYLLKTIVKAIQTMVGILKENPAQADEAVALIATLVGEIMGMTALILLVGTIGSVDIKGILSIMVGMTILLRLGIGGLLNTVSNVIKQSKGRSAINKTLEIFKSLVTFISVFSGVVILLTALASLFGSDGKIKSTFASIGLVIASIGALIYVLGDMIRSAKDVSSENLSKLAGIIKSFEIFVGVIVALVAVISLVPAARETFATIMLSLAATMAAVGVAFLGAGVGIYYFIEGLNNLIKYLPTMISNCVATIQSLANNIKPLIKALVDLIVNALWGVTDEILNRAGEIGEAIGALAMSFVLAIVDIIIGVFKGIGKTLIKWGKNLWNSLLNPNSEDVDTSGLEGMRNELEKKTEAQKFSRMSGYSYETSLALQFDPDYDQTAKNLEEAYMKFAAHRGTSDYDKLGYEQLVRDEQWKVESIVGGLNGIQNNLDLGSAEDAYLSAGYGNGSLAASAYGEGFSEAFGETDSTSWIGSDLFNESALEGVENEGVIKDIMSAAGYTDGDAYNTALVDIYGNESTKELLAQKGKENYEEYTKAGETATESAKAIADDVASAAIAKFYEMEPEFFEAGYYSAAGYVSGFSDKSLFDIVGGTAQALVLDAKNQMTKTAKISSPSRVFMEIGRYVTLGFAKGIEMMSGAAEAATEDVGQDSMSALQSVIRRIFDTTVDGMDTNPTITPVLDLSQVETGLTTLDGMLTNSSSFGLAFGNAQGFNNNMAAKFNAAQTVQNGYDDSNIVEAIGLMRNDISGLKGAMEGMGIYIDKRTLVGAIADPMSAELDKINVSAGRGVR